MRKILFATFFAWLFLCQPSHAQTVSGACFYAGGPIFDSFGCSTVILGGNGGLGARAGISPLLGTDFEASGEVTGDFGAVTGGSTSMPCQIFESGAAGAPINFSANASPGVHKIKVTFTGCGTGSSFGPWIGNLTVVVLPANPATNPPPPCGVELIDPVKSGLLQALANNNETAILNTSSSTPSVSVQGVSADGVTRVIVAVPTANVGDSVQLNLINDANTPSSSSAQDGGLTTLGGSVSSLSNSISLTADMTTSIGPTAFAIYVAPSNYARGTQNFPQDNTTIQRFVSLQTTCLSSGGSPSSPTNTPVKIVRPPVMLIHGLWSSPLAWNNFAPTAGSAEAQLWFVLEAANASIWPLDYSAPVAVGTTTPAFSDLPQVSGNALGFEYNAPIVLGQMRNAIGSFGSYFDVAASQADVVAHSMGALITRTMALPNEPWNYFTNATYGQGLVEKLITVGAPHLGSPLAVDLLPLRTGQDPNACVRNAFASYNDVAIQGANIAGASVNGGVSDLEGDGQDTTGLSLILQSLDAYQSTQPFPMAYLAGTLSAANLAGLNCTFCKAWYLANLGCPSSPLAQNLTAAGWPIVFGANNPSDGVVPLTSQLNGGTTGSTVTSVIHTAGLEGLDFLGPSELDSGAMAVDAVDLLNEAKSGSDFQH